jgi:hypothetical protein
VLYLEQRKVARKTHHLLKTFLDCKEATLSSRFFNCFHLTYETAGATLAARGVSPDA